jgi:hypothetical protein
MSKSNQRKIDSLHESGHAITAWLQGVRIIEMRLVPDDEPGKHAATTTFDCPGAKPEDWTLDRIVSQMRITLAGTEGDKRGPSPVSTLEREFAKWEDQQHQLEAMQYAKQFGANRINEADIPALLAGTEQDVIAVFRHACVVRCLEALARKLLRRETIPGPDAEAFIAARISEEERAVIRRECCLTSDKKMQDESPSPEG